MTIWGVPIVIGLIHAPPIQAASVNCYSEGKQVGLWSSLNWSIVYIVLFPVYLICCGILSNTTRRAINDVVINRLIKDANGKVPSKAEVHELLNAELRSNNLLFCFLIVAALCLALALEAYRANLRMFDSLMQMTRAMGAFRPGPVIVAAAGNESKTNIKPDYKIAASLPAAAEGVISVGALQQANGKYGIAYFSNTFPQVAAPGVDILSVKVGGGLRTLSRTSMACPHVAGVAALWWEALRKSGSVAATAQLVLARLLASARTDLFAAGVSTADRGAGMITAPP